MERSDYNYKLLYLRRVFDVKEDSDGELIDDNPENIYSYTLDYTKRQSTCHTCDLHLYKGEFRVNTTQEGRGRRPYTYYHHWHCIRKHLQPGLEKKDFLGYNSIQLEHRLLVDLYLEINPKKTEQDILEKLEPAVEAFECDNCEKLCRETAYECNECKNCHFCCECNEILPISVNCICHNVELIEVDTFTCDKCSNAIANTIFHCMIDTCRIDICENCCEKEIANSENQPTEPFTHDHSFYSAGLPTKQSLMNLTKRGRKRLREEGLLSKNEIKCMK